jgi:hypothetical protein
MRVEKNEDECTDVCEYVRFHGLQKLQKGFTQVDARVLLFTNLQQALGERRGRRRRCGEREVREDKVYESLYIKKSS